MKGMLDRLLLLFRYRRGGGGSMALGGVLDSLVQSFENCRPGLPDGLEPAAAEGFFLDIYQRERPRMLESLKLQAPYIGESERARFLAELDVLVRSVVIPGYVRLAVDFIPRERNAFFLLRRGLHGLERALWALAGIVLGYLAIRAPFIPIWADWWVSVSFLLGFCVPGLRRLIALRGYEEDLNEMVTRADRELGRIDMAYLTAGRARGPRPLRAEDGGEDDAEGGERKTSERRRKLEEGG